MCDSLPRTPIGDRDRALLLTGFAGALRRSELVALDVHDLTFGTDGVLVRIRRSKTDQEGEGATIGLPYGSCPTTCPVRALQAWLAHVHGGAVFRTVTRYNKVGDRLPAPDVGRIIKRRCAQVGLDPLGLSGHSLRAGLATSAAKAGKSDRSIQRQGRWASSDMVNRYVREADALGAGNAAVGIGL